MGTQVLACIFVCIFLNNANFANATESVGLQFYFPHKEVNPAMLTLEYPITWGSGEHMTICSKCGNDHVIDQKLSAYDDSLKESHRTT